MLSVVLGLALASTTVCGIPKPQVIPAGRAITDQHQAVETAYSAAAQLYGREVIDREKPLNATRSGSVWKVRGTLPPMHLGGVVEMTLSVRYGSVIEICHGK
jgi:hypothetical protein